MKNIRTLLATILAVATVSSFAVEAQVAGSMKHTVFIDNGNVFATGLNNYRQTNPNTTTAAAQYPQLSTESVNVPAYTGVQNAKVVAAQGNRSVAITNDGKLVFWGQLATSTWSKPYQPLNTSGVITDAALTSTELYVVSSGWLFSWNFNTAPVLRSQTGDITSIAAGDKHLVVLHADGTVSTLGSNTNGQLGYGNTATVTTTLVKVPGIYNAVEIAANTSTTLVRLASNEVWGWGKNGSYQLGLNHNVDQFFPTPLPGATNVKKVAVNYNSTYLHMADNTVKAAGWHNYISGSVYNTNKTYVTLPGITNAKRVHAGGQQIYVDFGVAGQLRGWGGNAAGQLGDTTLVERHTLTYAYYTPVAAPVTTSTVATTQPVVVASATGTCGSIYSNPFGNASNSNNNGAACKDKGLHTGR